MHLAIDLLELYKDPAIKRLRGHAERIRILDHERLAGAYRRLRDSAPRRHQRGKRYFVEHDGCPSGIPDSRRREEHLALALWNEGQHRSFALPDGRRLRFLDYQFPLKARRDDCGIGKIDLLGAIEDKALCVVELRIEPNGNGLGDTPLRACLEALA
jgi:hypothetical protein